MFEDDDYEDEPNQRRDKAEARGGLITDRVSTVVRTTLATYAVTHVLIAYTNHQPPGLAPLFLFVLVSVFIARHTIADWFRGVRHGSEARELRRALNRKDALDELTRKM